MARVKIGNVYPTDEYLLARCAPAGYGLGGYCKNIDHWDNATACGWYSTANGSPTAATESTIWVGEVTADPLTGQITQIVRAQGKDATYEATRHFFDNRWSPWEWENPPMELGVEYRTTERFMGKPVYTKLFNFGVSADGASIAHELNPNTIVRYSAVAGSIPLPHFNTVEPEYQITVSVGATNITMSCGASRTGLQTYVQLWYTKD